MHADSWDVLNNTARGIGFLVLGALVGWIVVVTIDSLTQALYRRREGRRKTKQWWEDDSP